MSLLPPHRVYARVICCFAAFSSVVPWCCYKRLHELLFSKRQTATDASFRSFILRKIAWRGDFSPWKPENHAFMTCIIISKSIWLKLIFTLQNHTHTRARTNCVKFCYPKTRFTQCIRTHARAHVFSVFLFCEWGFWGKREGDLWLTLNLLTLVCWSWRRFVCYQILKLHVTTAAGFYSDWDGDTRHRCYFWILSIIAFQIL